jgi:hypothetical protein
MPPSAVHKHFFLVTITDDETGTKEQKRKCRPCANEGKVKLFAERSSTTTQRDHHEQQLQAAAVNYVPPMQDAVMDLKKKIMLYIRGMDVVESVAAAAAAEDVIVPS